MPINVCQNNHITGYKKCPRCGTATERQVAPFHHAIPYDLSNPSTENLGIHVDKEVAERLLDNFTKSFPPDFHAVGRLSSSEPNLQNIPVKGRPGKKVIRKFRGDNA